MESKEASTASTGNLLHSLSVMKVAKKKNERVSRTSEREGKDSTPPATSSTNSLGTPQVSLQLALATLAVQKKLEIKKKICFYSILNQSLSFAKQILKESKLVGNADSEDSGTAGRDQVSTKVKLYKF